MQVPSPNRLMTSLTPCRCSFCAKGFYANSDPGFANPSTLIYPLTPSTTKDSANFIVGTPSDVSGGTRCTACPAGYFSLACELYQQIWVWTNLIITYLSNNDPSPSISLAPLSVCRTCTSQPVQRLQALPHRLVRPSRRHGQLHHLPQSDIRLRLRISALQHHPMLHTSASSAPFTTTHPSSTQPSTLASRTLTSRIWGLE